MLTINPVANKQNPTRLSFGRFFPRKVFYDIRDIPRMKCGCCGHDMLTSDETADFIRSFAAGSKRALENSAMDKFRGTPAFEFLKSLSEILPKATISKLLEAKENRFKLKTLDARTQLDVNMMALISDGVTVKAPRVMQKLEKYRDFFSKEDSETLKLMDMYAFKYPKKTFAEIFNMPEVAQYHREIHEMNKAHAAAKRIEVFKRLSEFAKDLAPEDKRLMQSVNTKAINVLNSEYFDGDIKKGFIEDLYNGLADSLKGKIRRKKLMKIVEDFPIIGHTPDSFVTQCVNSKKTDKDIVSHFVKSLQATYEHFNAKSRGGEDSKANIIILCRKCNLRRANLPYPFFLRFEPQMMQYLQKQFNKVMTFIKHGKLIGYDDYPIVMKQNILEGSDDLIRLKIGDYLQFRRTLAANEVEKTLALLENDELRLSSANEKLSEIDAKIKELEAQIRKLKKERQPVKEEYDAAKTAQKHSKAQAASASGELDLIDDSIKFDRETNASLKYKRRKLKK